MPTDTELERDVTRAHQLGKHERDPVTAAALLLRVALAANDQQIETKVEALQQAGVYIANTGDHAEALAHYDVALQLAVNDRQRGNILRDRARSQMSLGQFGAAISSVQQAMNYHPEDSVEYWVDQAFLGRIRAEEAWRWYQLPAKKHRHRHGSNLDAGITLMHNANRWIMASDDFDRQELGLYNMLHLATALARRGRYVESRAYARDCIRLVNEGHGSLDHKRRAQALLYGSWPAETALRRLQPLVLKVRRS